MGLEWHSGNLKEIDNDAIDHGVSGNAVLERIMGCLATNLDKLRFGPHNLTKFINDQLDDGKHTIGLVTKFIIMVMFFKKTKKRRKSCPNGSINGQEG